ncbi:MAG: S1 RNA-binding domain-containing protein [Anaerolineales bacterium]|nr:S1 RNA-binding domain-containing protein [Anaerolineales bacterium]
MTSDANAADTSLEGLSAAPTTSETPTATPRSIADLTLDMEVKGKVAKVELAGAFIDLGLERPGFLHISQLSTERVNNVTDVVKEGDDVTAYIQDIKNGRISLTLIRPPQFSWRKLTEMIGATVHGKVVRLEKFGAFVDIGAERPGLIHVSELSDEYVGSPEAVVSTGDTVEARIIGVDPNKRQIDLSMKSTIVEVTTEAEEETGEELTAMAFALRRAMEQSDKDDKRRRRDKKNSKTHSQSDILNRTLQMQSDKKN